MRLRFVGRAFSLCACSIFIPSLFAEPTPPPDPSPSPFPIPAPLEELQRQIGDLDPADPPTLPPTQHVASGPAATIVLPTTESAIVQSRGGIFPLVGLPPGQLAKVTVHYPLNRALQSVHIEMLDGGTLLVEHPSYQVPDPGLEPYGAIVNTDANGVLTFMVRLGMDPGLYQVRLQQGADVLGLQFWVSNVMQPDDDPPLVKPTGMGVTL